MEAEQTNLFDIGHRALPKTLTAAREEYFDAAEGAGMACPCCDRFGRKYRRKFNSGMAASLVWLVGEYGRHPIWVDVPKVAPRSVVSSREFDKLALWGMAAPHVNEDTQKRCSGVWRPTILGERFVRGVGVVIYSHAIVYNGKVERWDGESIDVVEALGERFDYAELLAGRGLMAVLLMDV